VFLALLLTIGFYLLALVVVALLLLVVYVQVQYLHRVDLRLTLICLAAAAAIVWSIVPRRDRFVPPGPRLEPGDHYEAFHSRSSSCSWAANSRCSWPTFVK
jgi:hypothetical protein